MKILTFISLLLGMSTTAWPQGAVYFSNRVLPNVDAPVYFPGGLTKEMVSRLTVELSAGTDPTNLISVCMAPFLTNLDGYFDAGVVSTVLPVTTNAYFRITFRTPATGLTNPHDKNLWFEWGESPVFSGSLGDTNLPGILSGLGTAPLILAVPRLSIRLTQTKTPSLSWEVPTNGYGLLAVYRFEQNPDLNPTNWAPVTTNSGTVLQRSMFYRLSIH